MQEPRPAKVTAPSGSNPSLKVGIVLKQDHKSSLILTALHDGYQILSANKNTHLPKGSALAVQRTPAGSNVLINGRLVLADATGPIQIEPPPGAVFAPGHGLRVRGVTAGRGFHWRKDTDQILPGTLVVHPSTKFLQLVNIIDLESYITCVISSEMAAECPPEFVKAQAVAARSWALCFLGHKHPNEPYTICNDDDCQRYQGTTHLIDPVIAAVRDSRGEFLMAPDNHICAAYYAKSCGGCSESPDKILGFQVSGLGARLDAPAGSLPTLKTSQDFAAWLKSEEMPQVGCFCAPASVPEQGLKRYLGAVDEQQAYFRWEHSLSYQELVSLLKERLGLAALSEVIDMEPLERGPSGRIVKLAVHYHDHGGRQSFIIPDQYEIRRALHPSFMLSSAFVHHWGVDANGRKIQIKFSGAGWGHGLGLCQIGAVGMALQGRTYREILEHYYSGCHIIKAY